MLKMQVDDTWVKCSLHCHSTSSDGALKPEDVVDYYAARGYGLIAITDHGRITRDHFSKRGLVTLPGIEISKGETRLEGEYHIVALGIEDQSINELRSPSEVIEEVNSAGGLAFLAHPYWSGLTLDDLLDIKGYIGIEVYNTGCDVEVAKGHSLVHWDELLSSGVRCWGFAVDDAHRYSMPPFDADGGWVWLEVADGNPEEALRSLRGGRFYSTTGPEIRELLASKYELRVNTTPVSRVNLISRDGTGLSVRVGDLRELIRMWNTPGGRGKLEDIFDSVESNEEGGVVKVFVSGRGIRAEASFDEEGLRRLHVEAEFKGGYLRVEAVDGNGRTAWSNPMLL